jgi:fumarate reductase flavoprotein subunit
LTLGEPPFYAAHLHAYTNLSWAGLRVNTELAVLRADDTPIGGLFAVGEILGFSTFSGHAHVGGMSLGPAISLGRYLGHRLGARAVARQR